MIRSVIGRPGGVVGAELSESEAALRVFLAAGGLLLAGLVLLLLTIWWWRGTKPEPEALGPLEVMGDRKWATSPDSERRRLLEEYRPAGAVPSNIYIEPEPVDLGVLAREAPPTFDDLRDPVDPADSESADPEALEVEAEQLALGPGASEPVVGPDERNERAIVDGDAVDDSDPSMMHGRMAEDGTLAMVAPVLGDDPHDLDELDELEERAQRSESSDADETRAMMSPDQPVSPRGGQ